MKITLSPKPVEQAPKDFVQIIVTEEDKGTRRFISEAGAKTGEKILKLEIGVGKYADLTLRKFIIVSRSFINAAKQNKVRKIALPLDAMLMLAKKFNVSPEELLSIAIQNSEMANFEFTQFKTKPKDGWQLVDEILLCGPKTLSTPAATKSFQAAVKRGQLIGQAINDCRVLANTPGGDMSPRQLAKAAKAAVAGLQNVTVQTLGEAELKKLNMGALLGVGSGSSEETTFTILTYKGGKASEKPIVLAGKGITFDSGGLNLKPSTHIYEMHMDMSGAASVIYAVALAAKLGIKKNVIGLIPAAENMPGNNAMRPGDVLRSMSGKTIEVQNTDAEGRLILADALTYAKKFKPSVVLDVATLTGAALVALGLYASAVLTKDENLAQQLQELGERSGDYVWPLPMWEEYEFLVKSDFADVTNSSNAPGGRYGGTIEGGMFLWQFAQELDCPWAHIDIAPRMTSAPGDELAKGAAGAPVSLLLAFIEAWKI